MSSNPAFVKNANIFSSLRSTSGCSKFALRSPSTSSPDLRGRSLSSVMTLFTVKMLSGAEVTFDDVPLLLSCRQMEDDNV